MSRFTAISLGLSFLLAALVASWFLRRSSGGLSDDPAVVLDSPVEPGKSLTNPPLLDVKTVSGLIYGVNSALSMNLQLPNPSNNADTGRQKPPWPLILVLHGGSWRAGRPTDLDFFAIELAKRGFAAASAQYRFAPRWQWPTQAQDALCAIKLLVSRKEEFQIDSKRLFAAGFSAGGHISLMLGLQGRDGESFHVPAEEGSSCGSTDIPSPISLSGVANFFGPADLADWAKDDWGASQGMMLGVRVSVTDLLGTNDTSDPKYKTVSPTLIAGKGAPPIISFHGTDDIVVPLRQSKDLHKRLGELGTVNELEILEGEGHGWRGSKMIESTEQVVDFFLKHGMAS